MDVLSLNQRFIRELLELYRSQPAVWQLKAPEYKNKAAKAQAYEILVQKCREYVPDADREFVKNKINSLRTSFRKELRKVQASMATAKHHEEIYQPNLWYYHLLEFTATQEINEATFFSVKLGKRSIADSSIEQEDFYEFKREHITPDSIVIEEADPLSADSPIEEIEEYSTPSPIPPPPAAPIHSTPVVTKQSNAHTLPDVFDAIGKNVAHKLRCMTQQQRIIAEKIISDVMYHGQMETLTTDSHLSLNKCNGCS